MQPHRKEKSCLNCGGPLTVTAPSLFDSRFGTPGSYTVAACRSCSLEQMTPLPSPGELKELYEAHYNFGGERNTIYASLRRLFLFSPLYRWWTRIDGDFSFHTVTGGGRLLDLGCNEGRALQFYRRNGWRAEGMELNARAAEVAREAGFTVHEALVEDFVPEEPYDVVVLSNVIEHSLNPHEMLEHVRRLVKPGGQLWISCPNADSILRKIFGRCWINWHVPFHTVQFSLPTLLRLLDQSGFCCVGQRQETPAAWVANSVLARIFARPGRPTRQLRNPFLLAALIPSLRVFFFPLFWLANRFGRGDCLVVTATHR